MKTLQQHLDFYRSFHTNTTNKLMHYAGTPCVIVAILMALNWVSLDIAAHWKISFAWFLVVAALVYYYLLNIRLAVLATIVLGVVTIFCALLAGPTPSKFSGSLFLILLIAGIGLQIFGHSVESKKPNLQEGIYLFITSPLFWLIELVSFLGLKKVFDIHHENNK